MHKQILEAIENILDRNKELLSIAIKQRAKFEGWLKFELAYWLKEKGFDNVCVEPVYENNKRADISFYKLEKDNKKTYLIELKTPNTNFTISNIDKKTRPITKNISSIVKDYKKLIITNDKFIGIVAFIMFPINSDMTTNDKKLKKHMDNLINGIKEVNKGFDLKANDNYKFIDMTTYDKSIESKMLICSFRT